MAADLGFRQKEIASHHLTHCRKVGRLRTMPCGLYTIAVATDWSSQLLDAPPRDPAALRRGFGDLVLQVAGLMITAELAQRCLVQLK